MIFWPFFPRRHQQAFCIDTRSKVVAHTSIGCKDFWRSILLWTYIFIRFRLDSFLTRTGLFLLGFFVILMSKNQTFQSACMIGLDFWKLNLLWECGFCFILWHYQNPIHLSFLTQSLGLIWMYHNYFFEKAGAGNYHW